MKENSLNSLNGIVVLLVTLIGGLIGAYGFYIGAQAHDGFIALISVIAMAALFFLMVGLYMGEPDRNRRHRGLERGRFG